MIIDSSGSKNFISRTMVNKLQLKTEKCPPYKIGSINKNLGGKYNLDVNYIESNPVFYKCSKHNEVRCHFICRKVMTLTICAALMKSKDRLANFFYFFQKLFHVTNYKIS